MRHYNSLYSQAFHQPIEPNYLGLSKLFHNGSSDSPQFISTMSSLYLISSTGYTEVAILKARFLASISCCGYIQVNDVTAHSSLLPHPFPNTSSHRTDFLEHRQIADLQGLYTPTTCQNGTRLLEHYIRAFLPLNKDAPPTACTKAPLHWNFAFTPQSPPSKCRLQWLPQDTDHKSSTPKV